jgi:hypothetical protein
LPGKSRDFSIIVFDGGVAEPYIKRGQIYFSERMTEWCAKLLQAGSPDSFLVKSTIRQFRRYRQPSWHEGRKQGDTLAAAALQALGDDS